MRGMARGAGAALLGLIMAFGPVAAPALAAGADDFATFCAGCHGGTNGVLRKIRRWPATERRARLAHFLEGHYCGGDRDLAAGLAAYLDGLARGR